MSKVTVYKPQLPAETPQTLPVMHRGGPVESFLTRWDAKRSAKTMDALTVRSEAASRLTIAEAGRINSEMVRRETLMRLAEQPEILAHGLTVRREERTESLKVLRHTHEVHAMSRETERVQAEVVLTDAQQQLKAQQEHGYLNYSLQWKKRQHEILGVDMDVEEMRALLRDKKDKPEAPNDEITEVLYAYRDQLNAAGLDTTRIDALIKSRKHEP